MAAPTLTAISVTVGSSTVAGTISGTASGGKYPVAIEVPYGTSVSALVTTITTTGSPTSVTMGGSAFTSGTTAVNYSSAKDLVLTNGDGSTTYTVTVTVDEESLMSVDNINMAGWFKVKVVKLKDFDYESGGFKPPYKSKAVLTVNGPGGLTGYVYTDTTGTTPVQKVKLFAGTSEASGEITADVYILIE